MIRNPSDSNMRISATTATTATTNTATAARLHVQLLGICLVQKGTQVRHQPFGPPSRNFCTLCNQLKHYRMQTRLPPFRLQVLYVQATRQRGRGKRRVTAAWKARAAMSLRTPDGSSASTNCCQL